MTWRREVNVFTSEGVRSIKRGRSRFLDILADSGKKKKGLVPSEALRNDKMNPTDIFGTRRVATPATRNYSTPSTAGMPRVVARTNRDYTSSRRARPSSQPLGVPPPLSGTTNVFAKERKNSFTEPAKQTDWPRRDHQNAYGEPSSSAHESNPKRQRSPIPGRRNTAAIDSRDGRNGRKGSTQNTKATMDSTWFYPVGTKVVHKNLGEGTVLPSSTAPKSDGGGASELLVYVKFENGLQRHFPVAGSDLLPVMS